MALQELRVHISNHKQEAERANSEWHESFETSKAVLRHTPPLARSHLLILPQWATKGDLWDSTSFKPLHTSS